MLTEPFSRSEDSDPFDTHRMIPNYVYICTRPHGSAEALKQATLASRASYDFSSPFIAWLAFGRE